MARPLHLTAKSAVKKRGSTYWFILSVPPDLRDTVGHSRWRFSLQTTEHSRALQLADMFLTEVKQKVRDSVDISSVYMRELTKLADYSPEDAEHLMDSLYPEVDESQAGQFYAARRQAGGAGIPPSAVTLQSVADSYLSEHPDKARTINDALRSFGPSVRLSNLTRKTVGDWIDRRRSEVSPRTIRIQLSNLRTLIKHAARHDLIPIDTLDILARWDLKAADKPSHKPIPDELYRMICEDKPEWAPVMTLMRLHGLRPSEVAGLELVDHEGHQVLTTTHSKTRAGRQRLIPVHPSITNIGELLAAVQPDDAKRLGQWLTNMKWRKAKYEPYRDKLINLYGCRVAAITDMGKAGIPEEVRQRLVGHSSSIHRSYIESYSYDQLAAGVAAIRNPLTE